MTHKNESESLMEATGLGLLPGLVAALGLIVLSMALLLTGSMWAVVALMCLIGIVTASILAVVFALIDEGELGTWLRHHIPGVDTRR
jgi:hypothetical protein